MDRPSTHGSSRLHNLGALALAAALLVAGCGGGSSNGDDPAWLGAPPPAGDATLPPEAGAPPPADGGGAPPPTASDYVAQAATIARAIVEPSGAAGAVEATQTALALGGVALADTGSTRLQALAPAASWTIDPGLAFNLAAEASARAVSGRLTVDQLARMWADFGFPFNGSGTPGDQLLAFLRAWLEDARAVPGDAAGFAPALIAELAARQDPPVELADPAVGPRDVQLSLLEIELLMAAFDRLFQLGDTQAAGAPRQRALAAGVADGACEALKKYVGSVAGKVVEGRVKWAVGQITDQALSKLGMTAAEIQAFGTYGKILGAVSTSLKVVKMAQIYASGQVALSVGGPNPVHKPVKNGARVLVPVKATAGVPDQDWSDYQQNNGSAAYQSFKSCLGVLGLPQPLDLKDIAAKVDGWRVAWDLVSGSPEHALIPSDVNVFDASSAGHPFGMKLVRTGPVAADATLKVDLKEEPELATLLQGPLVTSNVRVRAKVFTAEPPSPALLLQLTSLLGTIGALVDLSAGWIQTLLPPTSTTVVKVLHHDLPLRLQASLGLSMTYDYPTLRGSPSPYRHTISGSAQGTLERSTIAFGGDDTAVNYDGVIDFAFGTVGTEWLDNEDGCRHEFSYGLRNGQFQMAVGPHYSLQDGQLVHHPGRPSQVGFTGADVPQSQWPAEQQTHRIDCGGDDIETFVRPLTTEVFVAAANTLNLLDSKLMTVSETGAAVDGWDLRNSRLLTDGTLELRRTTPTTVTLLVQGGGSTIAMDTVVRSIDTVIRLKPSFAPPR
jgi:hypothetical protein